MTSCPVTFKTAARLAVVLTAVLAASSLAAVDLTGRWQGSIQLPGTPLEVTVDFARDSLGAYQGTIDIPAQGAKGLPLADVALAGDSACFAIAGIPGAPLFAGRLNARGDSLSGGFSQSGQAFPFALARVEEAAVQAEAAQLAARLDSIRAFVGAQMAVWHVPGLALAIVRDGKVILSEGFGFRSLEDSLPVTANTLFAIGSSTKAFTATVLAMLVDEGLIEWDKPVKTYLPTFKLDDQFASERMSPRDLVTHRSGLPRHDLMWYNSGLSRRELIERLQYLKPNEDFRTTFQYQNLMFLTAGCLAEQITGRSWEDVVRDRIFKPLAMSGSNFSVESSQRTNDYALPYRFDKDSTFLIPFRNISTLGPAGSINSNVSDMAKWVLFQLNGGKVDSVQLLSGPAMADLHTPHMVISQPSQYPEIPYTSYGMGWFVQTYRGHAYVEHGGNIDGFSALVGFFPNDNVGLVVLTNLDGSPLPTFVGHYLADLLLEMKPIDWSAQAKVRSDQAEEIDKQGKANAAVSRKLNTKPSHPLQDFVAEYENPGYGILTVELDKKQLRIVYNSLAYDLEHWHYDVFRAHIKELGDETIFVTFAGNDKGDIDRVSVPLEPTVDEIVFKRMAPAQLRDPEFLVQFVGEYEIPPQTMTFKLRGGKTLIAIMPGQPVYELIPYQGTEFNIKGLTGFSIEFRIDKSGKVADALFKQPNGVFPAKKTR